MNSVKNILEQIGLLYAYDHFAENESPSPPFIIYLLPSSNHMGADGRVWHKISRVHLEAYTNIKDLSLEQHIEAVLDKHSIFYTKSTVWIETEKLYEVLYVFEIEEEKLI